MSDGLLVQYVGFEAKPLAREYSFNVREGGADRKFTLNIANAAFTSRRARYQDAPGICAVRLYAELTAFSNRPPETQFDITDAELDNYRGSRSPKVGRNVGKRKSRDDF